MLLMRISRSLRRDDHGAALAAVMGLMGVGLIITTLIMTSVVSAVTYSTATRAGVQSQAAAEAGTAAALAGIQTAGSCAAVNGIYTSATAPLYRATVWRGSTGSWTQGCPTGTGQVRIIATGWASATGINPNASGDVAYLESVYAVGGTTASGSAIYMAGSTSLTNFSVIAGTGTIGSVKLPSGNFSCDSATTIQGDVIVAAGNASITNTCTITGDLRVSGSVTMSASAQVQGSVTASGGGVSLQNSTNFVKGNVYANGKFSSQGTVGGNVEATGNADLQGSGQWIKGSLTAGGTLERVEGKIDGSVSARGSGKTTFVPGSKVTGDLAVGGDLDTWSIDYNQPSSGASNNEKFAYGIKKNGWVTGTVTYRQTGLTMPVAKPAPVVPSWVDWSYKWSDWSSAGFVEEFVWPAALGCKIDNYNSVTPSHALYPYIQKLKNISVNTVVNMLGCSTFEFCNCGNIDLKLKADVAFVGNGFVLGAVKLDSNDSTDRKAWFLVPDAKPAVAGRNCESPSGSVAMYGESIIGPHLAATIYTPCNIQIVNKSKWRGQLYGGSMSMSAGDNLTYLPVGIPGTNLDGATGGATPGGLGALVTSRNRLDNGE